MIGLPTTFYLGVGPDATTHVLARRAQPPPTLRATSTDRADRAWLDPLHSFLTATAAHGAWRADVECPPDARPEDLVGMLGHDEDLRDAGVELASIVAVVDARAIEQELAGARGYFVGAEEDGTPLHVARSFVAASQIEHAERVVLVGWRDVARESLPRLLAVLGHLAQSATFALDGVVAPGIPALRTSSMPPEERPGWLHVLGERFAPHLTHASVSAVRYRNERPFHPNRLVRTLNRDVEPGRFGVLVRSCGLCRLATRAGRVARWEQVGDAISFDPMPPEPEHLLEPGQDLALFGLDLDADALTAALDACVLTDDELRDGPRLWERLVDPIPAWG